MPRGNKTCPIFEIVKEAEGLEALRPEWDDLWVKAAAPAFQSYEYTMLAWKIVNRSPSARLHCLVGRIEGRLVALWPMLIERRTTLWRIMRPLGLISTESSNILVEPGEDAERYVNAAWKTHLAMSKADLLWLNYVTAGSPLQNVVLQQLGKSRILTEKTDTSWIVSWWEGESWDDWYNNLSSSYRRAQKKKYAILAKVGETRFEILKDKQQCIDAVDALLEWKREWAARFKASPGDWLYEPKYHEFLHRYFTTDGTSAQPRVCVLKLGEVPIAVLLVTVGTTQIDALIASFDPQYAQASPGIALYEHCLRWAHASKRSIDFGPGEELNKRYWCHDRPQAVVSYSIALTRWGVAGARSLQLARRGAGRLRGFCGRLLRRKSDVTL